MPWYRKYSRAMRMKSSFSSCLTALFFPRFVSCQRRTTHFCHSCPRLPRHGAILFSEQDLKFLEHGAVKRKLDCCHSQAQPSQMELRATNINVNNKIRMSHS